MKKILLSAFACDSTQGSEPSYGWNYAIGLAKKGFEVHCITREVNRKNIELYKKILNLHFHYIKLPFGLESLYSFSNLTMYLFYLLWQWIAYKRGIKLSRSYQFDVIHHVTWGSTQLGSFFYKLNIPFVFGPSGGGQIAPHAFKSYFKNYWHREIYRENLSNWMLKFNPACKKMLRSAFVVILSNPETALMAKKVGSRNIKQSLDVALPISFFSKSIIKQEYKSETLKLLWVGRFMARKGLLLVLDVMKELKKYNKITLTIVGDGEMKNEVLNRIKEYDLADTVFLTGSVSHEKVKDYYASHDVFFYTSLRDSGSLQLIEAMAYSLPIVTLNLHGQAIIVSDATGIRCSAETPEKTILELRDAILKLYNNPLLLNKLSANAYAFAKKQTWDKKIELIVNEYYPNNL
jgi:glycosyltransferase involved in cell wall biosynthesis